MDPVQAALAVKLLVVRKVIPMNYKTYPILEQNTSAFEKIMKEEFLGVAVMILGPGQEIIT